MGPVGTTAVPHFYTKKCAAARLSRSPPTGDPQVARTGFGLRAALGIRFGGSSTLDCKEHPAAAWGALVR